MGHLTPHPPHPLHLGSLNPKICFILLVGWSRVLKKEGGERVKPANPNPASNPRLQNDNMHK